MDLERYGVTPDMQLAVDMTFVDEVLRNGIEHIHHIPSEARDELERIFRQATGRLAVEVMEGDKHSPEMLRLLGKLSYLDTLGLTSTEELSRRTFDKIDNIRRYRRLFRPADETGGTITFRSGRRT